ncbi:hypothetical protein CCHR01_17393 [Colletotrichum chrysophilum]|uniref:Uncharacterized protein n=1 Tax=Colletotrichum chrysophilum TaxID=1836956 RepID=A0AAD9A6P4_9PEZI|nr:hypothetical protein CCHR01_17393 [Colletotrichum chrysophilum]
MKRPCRGSLSTKASNQDADANETEDDGTARCERRRAHNRAATAAVWVPPLGAPDVKTPSCDEGHARRRDGGFRKTPRNEKSSPAGGDDAVHEQTDMSEEAITSSKPISALDIMASPYEEEANVEGLPQTGSRRHLGSREVLG